MSKPLTTTEAAALLGITPRRVQALIASGRLPAVKFGRAFAINAADLAKIKDRRAGRPEKAK